MTTHRTVDDDLNGELTEPVLAKEPTLLPSPQGEGGLSPSEHTRLAELEAVIETHIAGFVEVGGALIEIQDARLYRESHPTFEQYLADRWEVSRSRGYRLIAAAHVVEVLSPTGDTPANEAQARELVPLLDDPKKMREVYEEAAVDGPPTAPKLRAVVKTKTTAAAIETTETADEEERKPTVNRRKAIRVRDLPDLLALLADPVIAKLEKTLGDQPTIKIRNRPRLLVECILDDITQAIRDERTHAQKLREQAKQHDETATMLAAVEKKLRPIFADASHAANRNMAARARKTPGPRRSR